VAVKQVRKPLTAEEKRIADRVARAKRGHSPVNRTSNYHEQLGELARECGVPVDEVIEEWSSRAAAREYDGGFTRDEAEFLAMDDTRQRLRRAA
jgi:hypothetical protein